MLFFHALALHVNVGIIAKLRSHVSLSVVPIEENLYTPITFEVCSSAKDVEMQDHVHL